MASAVPESLTIQKQISDCLWTSQCSRKEVIWCLPWTARLHYRKTEVLEVSLKTCRSICVVEDWCSVCTFQVRTVLCPLKNIGFWSGCLVGGRCKLKTNTCWRLLCMMPQSINREGKKLGLKHQPDLAGEWMELFPVFEKGEKEKTNKKSQHNKNQGISMQQCVWFWLGQSYFSS